MSNYGTYTLKNTCEQLKGWDVSVCALRERSHIRFSKWQGQEAEQYVHYYPCILKNSVYFYNTYVRKSLVNFEITQNVNCSCFWGWSEF